MPLNPSARVGWGRWRRATDDLEIPGLISRIRCSAFLCVNGNRTLVGNGSLELRIKLQFVKF